MQPVGFTSFSTLHLPLRFKGNASEKNEDPLSDISKQDREILWQLINRETQGRLNQTEIEQILNAELAALKQQCPPGKRFGTFVSEVLQQACPRDTSVPIEDADPSLKALMKEWEETAQAFLKTLEATETEEMRALRRDVTPSDFAIILDRIAAEIFAMAWNEPQIEVLKPIRVLPDQGLIRIGHKDQLNRNNIGFRLHGTCSPETGQRIFDWALQALAIQPRTFFGFQAALNPQGGLDLNYIESERVQGQLLKAWLG